MPKQAEVPKFNYEITGEDLLLSKMEKLPCLVDPFLQQSGLACLGGSSDTGKSSLLRQLAISIAAGDENFLGFKINARHKSVIYVATEDDMNATTYLLKRQANEINPELLRGLRFLFEPEDLFKDLDKRLKAAPADLVIIDCFADVFGENLNDTHLIRTFLNRYQRLSSNHDCLILFLHHTGKRTEDMAPSKNHLLGGQGFEAKMRLVIEFRADTQATDIRHLCIVKGNYLPGNFKTDSYVLRFDEDTFSFMDTGVRVPFLELIKPTDKAKERFNQVIKLQKEGHNYDEIAKQLGFKSKGTISKIVTKGESQGWGETTPNPENENIE